MTGIIRKMCVYHWNSNNSGKMVEIIVRRTMIAVGVKSRWQLVCVLTTPS